jgi:hypothetical protein
MGRPPRHGHASGGKRSPEYRSWSSMHDRCNPSHKYYECYGGRDITICERWKTFDNFLTDMGLRPSLAHQLERIDNDSNYKPGNCRWATKTEQANNRRSNRPIAAFGRNATIAQWARMINVHRSTLRERLERGQSPEQALAFVKPPIGTSIMAFDPAARDGLLTWHFEPYPYVSAEKTGWVSTEWAPMEWASNGMDAMITPAQDERDLADALQEARVELRRVRITQMLGGWTPAGKARLAELESAARDAVLLAHASLRRWRRIQADRAEERNEEVARLPRRRTKEFRP